MASSIQPTATMAELPIDIQRTIFSQLPKRAVLSCRLVCRQLSSLATEIAFRHVELQAGGCGKPDAPPSSIDAFIRITETEHLRCLVREVTCDTFMPVRGKNYQVPGPFLSVLPRLACFRGLRILNFRFSNYITWDGDKHVSDTSGSGGDSGDSDDDGSDSDRSINFREKIRVRRELATETADFRFHVLNTAFQALMGTWTRGKRDVVKRDLGLVEDAYIESSSEVDQGPIELAALTVSDLSHLNDARLTKSRAFRAILATPTFQSLKLLITRVEDIRAPCTAVSQPETYKFYDTLPSTWLSPSVAQHLRVLSLYDRNYWGWCPEMNFWAINPAGGGLPNLRVLALGRCVFTHDRQFDWVAWLAKAGRLEELYLDDCPILWHARVLGRRPRSTPESYRHKSDGGKAKNVYFPLRWHDVLPRWRDAFAGSRMRVFAMGHGDWNGQAQVGEDNADRRGASVFLTYDLPPPRKVARSRFSLLYSYNPAEYENVCGATRRHGVGLRPGRGDVMKYIRFDDDGSLPWTDCNHTSLGYEHFAKNTRLLDDRAMEDFKETLGLRSW